MDILFYHGRPVAFKDYKAKTLYVITQEVTREVPFRKEFVSGWTGKIEFTGGQAPLEGKVMETLQSFPVPA